MDRVAARLKGMGFGSLFLSLFGGLWMLLALNAQSGWWLLCCILLPLSLLVVRSIGVFLASRDAGLREPPLTPEERFTSARLRRRFALIFAVEFGAIAVAANGLSATGHGNWIVAVIALIVGLHFLPLAWLFQYRLYYGTGAFEVILCGLIAWGMRAHLDAADTLFGFTMGISLWATAVIVLASAGRLARAAEPARGEA